MVYSYYRSAVEALFEKYQVKVILEDLDRQEVKFTIRNANLKKLSLQRLKRLEELFQTENITVSPKVVDDYESSIEIEFHVSGAYFPDSLPVAKLPVVVSKP